MSDKDFIEYLGWLEPQTWVWKQEESVLVFFDPEAGPREFVETATGEWSEMEVGHEDPADDFTEVIEPQLIILLNAKKKELQPQ